MSEWRPKLFGLQAANGSSLGLKKGWLTRVMPVLNMTACETFIKLNFSVQLCGFWGWCGCTRESTSIWWQSQQNQLLLDILFIAVDQCVNHQWISDQSVITKNKDFKGMNLGFRLKGLRPRMSLVLAESQHYNCSNAPLKLLASIWIQ